MGNKPEKQSENQYIETKRNSQTGSSVDGNLPLVQNESAVCVSEGETIKRGSQDDTDYKNVDDKKDTLQNQSLEDRFDKSDNGGGVLEFTIPTQPTKQPHIDVRPEVISKAEVGVTQCNQGKGYVIDDKLDNNEWTENNTKTALDLQRTLPNGNQPPPVTNEIIDNQSEVTVVAKHEKLLELFGMGNKPEKQSENQYIETKRNSQTGSSVDGNLPLVQNESAVCVSEGETIKRGSQDDTDYKNGDDKKDTLQNQSLEDRFDKSDNGGGVLEFTIPTQPTKQPHIDVRPEVISKAEVGVTQCNQGKGYVIDDKLDNNEWTENNTKTALDLQRTLPNGNQPPPVTNEIIDNQSEVTVVAKHEKLPELFGMGNKPEKQSENQYIETKRNSQTGSSVDGNLPLVQNESAVGVSEGETIKRGTQDDTDYKNVHDKKYTLQNQSLENRLDKSDNGGGVLEFTIPTQPTEQPLIDVRPEVISKAEVGVTQCNQGKGYVIDDKLDNNEWTENKTKTALDLQHTLPNGNQPPPVTNEIMDNQSEVTVVAKHEKLPELFGMGNKPEKQSENQYIETERNSQTGSSVDGNLPLVQNESAVCVSDGETIKRGSHNDTDYKNVDDKKDELQNQSLEDRLDKSDNGGGVLEFTIPTQPTEKPIIDVRPEVISKAEVGMTQCNQGKGFVIDDKLDNNEWTENKTKPALDLQHTLPNGNQPPSVTNEIMDNQSEVTDVAKHEFMGLCTHIFSIQKANREILKKLNLEESDRKNEEKQQLQQFSDLERILEHMEDKCRKKDKIILQLTRVVEQIYNKSLEIQQTNEIAPA